MEKDIILPDCNKCVHNSVCYLKMTCNDIEGQLRDFGCEDYLDKSVLDKALPKKPLDVQTPVVKWGICPTCKGEKNALGGRPNRVFSTADFCSDCGQAIDWTNT